MSELSDRVRAEFCAPCGMNDDAEHVCVYCVIAMWDDEVVLAAARALVGGERLSEKEILNTVCESEGGHSEQCSLCTYPQGRYYAGRADGMRETQDHLLSPPKEYGTGENCGICGLPASECAGGHMEDKHAYWSFCDCDDCRARERPAGFAARQPEEHGTEECGTCGGSGVGVCDACRGDGGGYGPDGYWETCDQCEDNAWPCPDCNGKGKTDSGYEAPIIEDCKTCGGSGSTGRSVGPYGISEHACPSCSAKEGKEQ